MMAHPHKPETETELKFALSEDAARILEHHPAMQPPRAGPPDRRHETSTYYDTPDRALSRDRIGLRVRQSKGRFVQTVKSAGEPGVAARRGEWEWEIAGDRPELDRLQGTTASGLIAPETAGRIGPVFVSDVERITWHVTLEGAVAEAALDRGHLRAGDRDAPVLEFELELQEGEPGPLYRLALELQQAAPLRMETDSKAARGQRLASGTAPEPAKLHPPGPGRQDNAAQAFRTLMLGHLSQLLANQAAARDGHVEGVHQLRIALRRIRSTLVLFAPLLDAPAVEHFTVALRRLGQLMGAARDWDVFCTHTLPGATAAEAGRNAGWEDLFRAPAEACRQAAHAALARALDGPDLTALVLGLAAWAEDGALHPHVLGPEGADRPLTDLAPSLLAHLVRKVKKRGRHLANRPDAERHAFRKSLKKLRYAIEDLSPVLPAEQTAETLKRCKKLLKLLGHANDAVAGAAMARSLATEARPDLAPALGLFERHMQRLREDAVRRMPRRWRALRDSLPS